MKAPLSTFEMKNSTKNLYSDLAIISDEQLFRMAKQFGSNALLWRRRFIGLLPEVNQRRLYEKKGYESIFVFAQKLAGLSQEQVRRALNLERKFAETPVLKEMLVSGEVSLNKLARVASIATKENQEELAEKVRVLPKSAIETLVRDEKFARNEGVNGLFEPKFGAKSVPGHKLEQLELSDEVQSKLLDLQEKGIDVNEFILKALEKREEDLEREKQEIASELEEASSRYIPVKVKSILQKEHGCKCSVHGCCRRAVRLHHTQPFAMSKTHDPRFLAPLCKDHHSIAHSINVKASEMRQVQRLAQ